MNFFKTPTFIFFAGLIMLSGDLVSSSNDLFYNTDEVNEVFGFESGIKDRSSTLSNSHDSFVDPCRTDKVYPGEITAPRTLDGIPCGLLDSFQDRITRITPYDDPRRSLKNVGTDHSINYPVPINYGMIPDSQGPMDSPNLSRSYHNDRNQYPTLYPRQSPNSNQGWNPIQDDWHPYQGQNQAQHSHRTSHPYQNQNYSIENTKAHYPELEDQSHSSDSSVSPEVPGSYSPLPVIIKPGPVLKRKLEEENFRRPRLLKLHFRSTYACKGRSNPEAVSFSGTIFAPFMKKGNVVCGRAGALELYSRITETIVLLFKMKSGSSTPKLADLQRLTTVDDLKWAFEETTWCIYVRPDGKLMKFGSADPSNEMILWVVSDGNVEQIALGEGNMSKELSLQGGNFIVAAPPQLNQKMQELKKRTTCKAFLKDIKQILDFRLDQLVLVFRLIMGKS